ncbi:MAG: hypothetical protein ABIG11_05235 [bacterium]
MKALISSGVLSLSLFLAGCGQKSTSDSSEKSTSYSVAYQECLEQVMEEGHKKNKGKMPSKMNRQFAEAACKIIKTECGKNPDGSVCHALLKKYGQE